MWLSVTWVPVPPRNLTVQYRAYRDLSVFARTRNTRAGQCQQQPMVYLILSENRDQVTSYEEELSHIPQSPHKRGCSAILRTEARMKSFTVQFTHMYEVLPTTLTSMNLLTFTGFDL